MKGSRRNYSVLGCHRQTILQRMVKAEDNFSPFQVLWPWENVRQTPPPGGRGFLALSSTSRHRPSHAAVSAPAARGRRVSPGAPCGRRRVRCTDGVLQLLALHLLVAAVATRDVALDDVLVRERVDDVALDLAVGVLPRPQLLG